MNLFQTLLSHRKHARVLAAGCVALAAGGIVLLRAPHTTSAAPRTGDTHTTHASPSGAPRVEFSGPWAHGRVALSQGRVLAGGQRQVFAEVRLAADNRQLPETSARPVAMALVLDVSGSMEGEKLVQARNAVLEMVDRMRDSDQISLVVYSDNARVVQPLARVRDVRAQLHMTVPSINTEGGTNIPSGLVAGAQTLSDAPEGVVRRVVLMSDGRDGSGQSIDMISAELRTRADRGVTLSSLGVGADYDETFMSRLADAGRGNYEFMRDGAQLRAFLGRELQQATRTTVERAVAEVRLPSGWHLTRAYGAEAQVTGNTVRLPVGALFAGDERRMVLDLTVDAPASGSAGALTADASWYAVQDGRDVRVHGGDLALGVTDSQSAAQASVDNLVFAEAQSTVLAARQQDAVNAWRDGRVAEATALAQQNLATLRGLERVAPAAAPALQAQARQYEADNNAFNTMNAESESGRVWGLQSNAMHRRAMRSSAAY